MIYRDPRLWTFPFHGIQNAVFNKMMSYGLYYTFLDYFNDYYRNTVQLEKDRNINMLTGASVGIINSLVTNPLNSIKYHAWGKEKQNLRMVAREMYQHGGPRAFTRGLLTTMNRDVTFGIIYQLGRNSAPEEYQGFTANTIAAGAATVFSSPFNYIRNKKYLTCYSHTNPSTEELFMKLYHNIMLHDTWGGRIQYTCKRLCIGYGTVRVAFGIAFGQWFYNWQIKKLIDI
jgi:hypothetical protein